MTLQDDLKRWRSVALAAGIAGAVLCAIGFFIFAVPVLPLVPVVLLVYRRLECGVAGLADAAISHRRRLGVVIRRPCEAAARTLPLVALMFVPIAIGIPNLYPWSHAKVVAADEILRHKQVYLNVPFFLTRAAIYLPGGFCFPGCLTAGRKGFMGKWPPWRGRA